MLGHHNYAKRFFGSPVVQHLCLGGVEWAKENTLGPTWYLPIRCGLLLGSWTCCRQLDVAAGRKTQCECLSAFLSIVSFLRRFAAAFVGTKKANKHPSLLPFTSKTTGHFNRTLAQQTCRLQQAAALARL